MSLQWMESYKLGNAEADAAQKALFDLANEVAALEDWSALRPLIVALYKQMKNQFALEEALMHNASYPAAEAHIAQHQQFLLRLSDRSMDVGKGHMNKKAIVAVMTDWAQNHVPTDDAALTRFLAATV